MAHFRISYLIFLILSFYNAENFSHDFEKSTPVVLADSSTMPIHQLMKSLKDNPALLIATYDEGLKSFTHSNILTASWSKTSSHYTLSFDGNKKNDVTCAPSQRFYRVSDESSGWVCALELKVGDALLCAGNKFVMLQEKYLLITPLTTIILSIPETHTFLVGNHNVVAHNAVFVPPVVISISFLFGSGAGPSIAAGCAVVLDLFKCGIEKFFNDKKDEPSRPTKSCTNDEPIKDTSCGSSKMPSDPYLSPAPCQNTPPEKDRSCGTGSLPTNTIYHSPEDKSSTHIYGEVNTRPIEDFINKQIEHQKPNAPKVTTPQKESSFQEPNNQPIVKTLDDILKDAKKIKNKSRAKSFKGELTQYVKKGDYKQCEVDFKSQNPTNIINLEGGKGKRGVLSDGRDIIIRKESVSLPKRPTFEVHTCYVKNNKKIVDKLKVRYER